MAGIKPLIFGGLFRGVGAHRENPPRPAQSDAAMQRQRLPHFDAVSDDPVSRAPVNEMKEQTQRRKIDVAEEQSIEARCAAEKVRKKGRFAAPERAVRVFVWADGKGTLANIIIQSEQFTGQTLGAGLRCKNRANVAAHLLNATDLGEFRE